MREILFRGKTKDGRWAYGSLIMTGSYCCILESEDDVHPADYPYLDPDLGTIDGKATPVIRETIGRLIDCPDYECFNGARYFEGDIVEVFPRHFRTIGPYDALRPRCRAILVDERSLLEEEYGRVYTQDTVVVKVIGNVYDSPDLIGEKHTDYYKRCFCLEPVKK